MVAASDKPFPVILLAPGSISFPSKYSSLAEDLASHGIVVVGDVPVGNGIVVPFPAGNVTRGYRGAMFDEWAGDLIYELDQLKVWNQTPRHLFFGRLDLGRVGAFGHSAAGGRGGRSGPGAQVGSQGQCEFEGEGEERDGARAECEAGGSDEAGRIGAPEFHAFAHL